MKRPKLHTGRIKASKVNIGILIHQADQAITAKASLHAHGLDGAKSSQYGQVWDWKEHAAFPFRARDALKYLSKCQAMMSRPHNYLVHWWPARGKNIDKMSKVIRMTGIQNLLATAYPGNRRSDLEESSQRAHHAVRRLIVIDEPGARNIGTDTERFTFDQQLGSSS